MNKLKSIVPEALSGERLDKVLSQLFPEHSRARLQGWIKTGRVQVDHGFLRQKDTVRSGQLIEIEPIFGSQIEDIGEDIPLDIIHEDEAMIILNKPAGLVVHPGAGNTRHTLLNGLLHFDPDLQGVPRAGIIQRLDKETSGIMVIARNPVSHTHLVDALSNRKINRHYEAIVHGVMTAGGTVDAPIGRHSRQRKHMTVTDAGKNAITHYRIVRKFYAHTHIKVQLETGRTHQIRVHMAHIKYPIIGDPVYGGRKRLAKNIIPALRDTLMHFPRQALHATRLELHHPVSGEKLAFNVPLPEDMQSMLKILESNENND